MFVGEACLKVKNRSKCCPDETHHYFAGESFVKISSFLDFCWFYTTYIYNMIMSTINKYMYVYIYEPYDLV